MTNNVRDFGVRMLADMSIAVARPDSFLIVRPQEQGLLLSEKRAISRT